MLAAALFRVLMLLVFFSSLTDGVAGFKIPVFILKPSPGGEQEPRVGVGRDQSGVEGSSC